MKKAILFLSAALLFACKPDPAKINGYVEGEFVYIAPTSSGNLMTRSVSRGDQVQLGQELFSIDTTNLEASLAEAQAGVELATSMYLNLTKGKRPEEIEVIQKQLAQAEASLENARKDYDRYKGLVKTKIVSQADYDDKLAQFKSSTARVQELKADLDVANLGSRIDEINAALSGIKIAKQRLVQAQKNLSDARPIAEVEGRVEDTFFRPGEFVPAGNPVVAILPPENIKVRFFVTQEQLPQMQLNRQVKINCDGCKSPINAYISFISSKAEFTPPVIYSIESREKLVYMIEANPTEFNESLRPGLPINIDLGN